MTLGTGDRMPAFSRTDHTGTTVASSDLAGKGIVVYFYPRAFTPGCTTESCDFRDRHEAFLDSGYEVLGVSPDPFEKLAKFRDEHGLPFALLSDEDHSMAEAFGAWGVKKNYGREYEGLIRSTFVIDDGGTVAHAWYNVRAKGHADRVQREIAAG